MEMIALTKTARRTVVVRDDDILTSQEMQQHKQEIDAATLEELKTRVHNKCVSRRPLHGAHNVMGSRHVYKWKRRQGKHGRWQRIIRVRLALRGFKDMDADSMQTFSGTARRTSQRLIASPGFTSRTFRGCPLLRTPSHTRRVS